MRYLAERVPYSDELPHITICVVGREEEEIRCEVCQARRVTCRIGWVGRESRIAFSLIHKACGKEEMPESQHEPFDVLVVKLTDNAALLEFTDHDDEQIWIPLSQIEDPDDLDEGEELTVRITDWIARKTGLI